MNEIALKIKEVREQRIMLENQEKELMSSMFSSECDVNDIYSLFIKEKNISRIDTVEHKKMFVFVCLSIYCPTFIIGDRIKSGTRNKIARVVCLHSSRISHIVEEVRFLYYHYKSFKQEADYLYTSIKRSLTS